MNCIEDFLQHPDALPALGKTTFGEMRCLAARMQEHVQTGDYVLFFGKPDAALYAAVIGCLGVGSIAIFVEPWMPLAEIEKIIAQTKPKIYVTNFLGRLWGLRSRAIRKIPTWMAQYRIKKTSTPLRAIPLPKDHIGMITFTTGTTGAPKGVVRTHGSLMAQRKILSQHLFPGEIDLCVLPNFVFLNLSLGKTSVFFESPNAHPTSVSCGPGILQKLVENAERFPHLRTFHIGGALTACSLYEEAFKKWPEAMFWQVYGSSEAEPVAIADARDVVKKCREKGYFQTLYLGKPVLDIRFIDGLLEVRGAHVSSKGWHSMGDRVVEDQDGLWYQGRASQPLEEFLLEQKISSFLQNKNLFIRGSVLIGENLFLYREKILKNFPEIKEVREKKIVWDRRHRARINREKTR